MQREDIIKVTGMSSAACSSAVSKALINTHGVICCTVNHTIGEVDVAYDCSMVTLIELEDKICKTGFGVHHLGENDPLMNENLFRNDLKRMVFAWIFATPLLVIMLGDMLLKDIVSESFLHFYFWIAIVFSSILYLFPGRQTFINALKSSIHKSPSMDALIAMGCIGSFITGCLPKLFGSHNFVEIGAMIMAIHLTGRYIETKTKGKTSEAIRKLMEMGAKSASILQENEVIDIPVSDLKIGDIMLVKPGCKIPTDGIITEGESYIDESMATGESMPVKKYIGKFVLGSTINGNGTLKVEVTKVGRDTFLSQMIKLVEYAQNTKVPVQAFADKVTGIFIPVALLVAGSAFIIHWVSPEFQETISNMIPFSLPWLIKGMQPHAQALFTAISVMIIACPSALCLATPTAIMAGIGLGTKHGILIRNGQAVQVLQKAKTIVFDKTGTLTEGKPVVTDCEVFKANQKETLQAIYSLEAMSDHPFAQAITTHLAPNDFGILPTKDFHIISGKGLTGTLYADDDSKKEAWTVGSMSFMEENFIELEPHLSLIQNLQREAKSLVFAARDMKLQAIIAIADTIKPDAHSTINMLHKMKLKTCMLTGDNAGTANVVGSKLGIQEVKSEVFPAQKLYMIKQYQSSDIHLENELIIMVGDGINDAPALKQADVSIAIGGGTDIAIESADIVLVRHELLPVVQSIVLSKTIFTVIKQNMFWAFFYNIVAIPLAFCGLLHPIIAGVAMALSSITVVTNANRLRNKELKLPC